MPERRFHPQPRADVPPFPNQCTALCAHEQGRAMWGACLQQIPLEVLINVPGRCCSPREALVFLRPLPENDSFLFLLHRAGPDAPRLAAATLPHISYIVPCFSCYSPPTPSVCAAFFLLGLNYGFQVDEPRPYSRWQYDDSNAQPKHFRKDRCQRRRWLRPLLISF